MLKQRVVELFVCREERTRSRQETTDRYGRLACRRLTCGVCGVQAIVNDERESVEWYGRDVYTV